MLRLSIPAAATLFLAGSGKEAVFASVVASGVTTARGAVIGVGTERALQASWRALLDALARRPYVALRGGDEGLSPIEIEDAIEQQAEHEALNLPRMVSCSVATAVIGAYGWYRFGPVSIALGITVVIVLLGPAVALQRWLGRINERNWPLHGEVAEQLEVVQHAGLELRAHGEERHQHQALFRSVTTLTRGKRDARAVGSVIALLPISLALLALLVPAEAGVGLLAEIATPDLPHAAVWGAAGLAAVMGLVTARASAVGSAANRRALRQAITSWPKERPTEVELSASEVAQHAIELSGVTHSYDGIHATPSPLDASWPPHGGVALVGDNGSGKSTMLSCLAGVLAPSGGEIRLAERVLGPGGGNSITSQVAFAVQQPFVIRTQSVGWHLDLFEEGMSTAARTHECLVALGAARNPREVKKLLARSMGDLSGGERRRIALVRALASSAPVLLLDEPEASLDAPGRAALRRVLADRLAHARIAIAVHDRTIVPESFTIVECVARPLGAGPASMAEVARGK